MNKLTWSSINRPTILSVQNTLQSPVLTADPAKDSATCSVTLHRRRKINLYCWKVPVGHRHWVSVNPDLSVNPPHLCKIFYWNKEVKCWVIHRRKHDTLLWVCEGLIMSFNFVTSLSQASLFTSSQQNSSDGTKQVKQLRQTLPISTFSYWLTGTQHSPTNNGSSHPRGLTCSVGKYVVNVNLMM